MRLLLLAALAAATLVLTQCQMVGDNLTGVSAGVFKRKNDCVKACADARKDAMKDETRRHADNERACGGNAQCHKDERDRFKAAKDAIDDAYEACVRNCHNQGGGDGD
jgi:hypothetical protein